MHFRQNRKANQNLGRGHSRSWFVGVEVCFLDGHSFHTIADVSLTGLDA